MSWETLLDEAIVKAKEAEDWQLMEWLRMARGGESAARWYSDKLREAHRTERKLLDENAKLRELVDELYPLADYGAMDASELDRAHDLMRELGMHDLMRELGIEAG